ncbi:MAG: hypothetical protein ACRC28_17375 [Clostridium sp.]|uniref:hypothetical protein n=1 Tax=Clostridium sp. TaxID=1506 RepID=UPI003F415D64
MKAEQIRKYILEKFQVECYIEEHEGELWGRDMLIYLNKEDIVFVLPIEEDIKKIDETINPIFIRRGESNE